MNMMKKPKVNSPTTNTPEARGIRVFVYGTLKRLHYNHHVIEDKVNNDTKFLGFCYIKGPYQMRDLGYYPGVQYIPDAKAEHRIYGEVYRVGEQTLRSLDILEGNGYFFTREHVETPWKKAWMYMIPPKCDRGAIITQSWKPLKHEEQFIKSDLPHMLAEDYFALTEKVS